MNGARLFPLLLLIMATSTAWCQERILYLKSGDTLEGTLAGETEKTISLRLSSGVVVSIDREQVESVETPESISALQEEFLRETAEQMEEAPEVDLRNVFQTVNPTPTPIPIRRLGSLQVRKKFKANEYRASLVAKDAEAEKLEPVRALPMIPEQDDEGNRNFGVITYLEPGPKVRRGSESWEVLEKDQLLNPGDEINTLEGRLEITTQKGNLVRIEPNTEFLLERTKGVLSRGRIWMQSFSRSYSAVDVGNISVRLQPNGLLHIETLRSGNKMILSDGQIRLHNLPETPRLLRTLQGPATIWVDGDNVLTIEEGVEPVQAARWEEWERKILESVTPAAFGAGLTADASPVEIDSERTKELLLRIADALNRLYLDVGAFPSETETPLLKSLFEDGGAAGWKGPYMTDIPFPLLDSHGNELVYRIFIPEGETAAAAGVYSKGPNNQFEEGEGDDLGILIPAPVPEAN